MTTQLLASDFDFISQFINKESAIVLEKGKEYLVESRLGPLAKERGYAGGIQELVRVLKTGDLTLKQKVIEALTTNETSFFRDLDPFDMLRDELIPEMLEKRKSTRELTIWCAAVSTGQEIYSINMILLERFPELRDWKVRLVGTDINNQVLARAGEGAYSQVEINRGLPATLLVKYFEKDGMSWKIKPQLKQNIELRKLNLLDSFLGMPKCDIVFIRNVLIYFDPDVKRQILGKIKSIMRPDGYLFLGAAETTLNLDDSFQRRSFRRGGCYILKDSLS